MHCIARIMRLSLAPFQKTITFSWFVRVFYSSLSKNRFRIFVIFLWVSLSLIFSEDHRDQLSHNLSTANQFRIKIDKRSCDLAETSKVSRRSVDPLQSLLQMLTERQAEGFCWYLASAFCLHSFTFACRSTQKNLPILWAKLWSLICKFFLICFPSDLNLKNSAIATNSD